MPRACHDAGVVRRAAASRLALAAVVAVATAAVAGGLAGCGGAGLDARGLVARCGLDCAADELRFRLARHPRDRALYEALAEIEEERGRPGAALDALEAAARLGRPFRAGLGPAPRARLARLLRARAVARVLRDSPAAEPDLRRALALGARDDGGWTRRAALRAIVAELAHTDPRRREEARARLARVAPELAPAYAGDAPVAALAAAAEGLRAGGARRAHHELLERAVATHGLDGLAAAPALLDHWLAARRWWQGPAGRPDLATLSRAVAAGAGPCWFPRPGGACDVIAAAAALDADGPPWEPELVTWWERDGVRAATTDEALAWMIVARRAVDRGQLASWERAVADHVDLAALAAAPRLPAWARPAVTRLLAGGDARAPAPGGAGAADGPVALASLPVGPRRVVAAEAAGGLGPGRVPAGLASLDGAAWPELAAALAAPTADDVAAFAAVARAHVVDPALAERHAEDVLARALDVAVAAPPLARLFALLGDPPRARALWQRAADAAPAEPALALGLALAMADAGDPAAGLLAMTRAAAAWGDAAHAMLLGARGFAAAGHPVEALTLARAALELSAPGDEAPAAAVAAALLDELGRGADAAALRALAPVPSAWDGRDGRAAVAHAVAAAGTSRRAAALARLARLAGAEDPALARQAAAALRALVDGAAPVASRGDHGVR